jgi:hypothetical protein
MIHLCPNGPNHVSDRFADVAIIWFVWSGGAMLNRELEATRVVNNSFRTLR